MLGWSASREHFILVRSNFNVQRHMSQLCPEELFWGRWPVPAARSPLRAALLPQVSFHSVSFSLLPALLPVWASKSSSAHKLMRHSVNNYDEGKFRL